MKEKANSIDWRIACTCALCIGAMEVTALLTGVDGKCLGIAIMAVSGLGGFLVGKLLR